MPLRRPAQYDTLLRVRKRQEDLKAQALAQARVAVRRLQAERDRITEEQTQTLRTAGERTRDQFDPGEVRRYYQYERHLARLADEKDASIRALQEIEEERRQDLDKSRKERRIVEKLRERKLAAYRGQIQQAEQKQLDEIAVNYAARGAARDAGSPGEDMATR